jgi:tetratricopeptide (TPR) repeat protein
MLSLQRHDFDAAAEAFGSLLERFPRERALGDRARVFLELCGRARRERPTPPQTREERLTAATAALNNGNEDEAERLARSVLAENPEVELALYLLAAVAARRGLADLAMQYLSQAIAVSPEVSAQARQDPDFAILRGLPAFRELTEASSRAAQRRRRGRGER